MNTHHLQQLILKWFDEHGRKNLPWQKNINHYRVWVSEIMLQQTQVATVIPYFERFMQALPTINMLANADIDQVLQLWAGLGYYSRARNLHRTAQMIVNEHQGSFPQTLETLTNLPGIGRSTAGAILAIVNQIPLPILDGNVKRVLCRLYDIQAWPGERQTEKNLWQLATRLTPAERADHYTQAVMDLGATLCTRTKPHCLLCPLREYCQANRAGTISHCPGKKPKRAYPTKERFMIVIKTANSIFLEKRPAQGIWGGLWALPLVETCAEVSQFTDKLKITPTSKLMRSHKFTHFQLNYTPIVFELTLHRLKII